MFEELIKKLAQFNASIKTIKPKLPKVRTPQAAKNTGISPDSKKDPVKVAEQIRNPDEKPLAMDAAKIKRETLKLSKNGQWSLEKKAPKGVDSDKHESCVMGVKDKGHDVGSAHAICSSSLKKEEQPFHGYNKNKHSKEGGLSESYRKKYNRKTGANLQKPVTSSEAKNSDKKAARRKSFCARMGGVKGPTSKGGKLTRKGAALKRWDCNKTEEPETLKFDKNGQWSMEKRCWEGYEPTPGKKPYEEGSCKSAKKNDEANDVNIAPEDSKNRKTYKEAFKDK